VRDVFVPKLIDNGALGVSDGIGVGWGSGAAAIGLLFASKVKGIKRGVDT